MHIYEIKDLTSIDLTFVSAALIFISNVFFTCGIGANMNLTQQQKNKMKYFLQLGASC